MESWKQTLAELARDRLVPLKRQAFLLCGDDSHAEDLVQEALVRAFARPLRAEPPRVRWRLRCFGLRHEDSVILVV